MLAGSNRVPDPSRAPASRKLFLCLRPALYVPHYESRTMHLRPILKTNKEAASPITINSIIHVKRPSNYSVPDFRFTTKIGETHLGGRFTESQLSLKGID